MAQPFGGWFNKRPTRGIPFEIICRCGTVCRGHRLPHHQELPCPGCRRLVFVLPRSPLVASGQSVLLPASPSTGWPIWLVPALAGGVTLLICVAGYFVILNSLVPDVQPRSDPRAAILDRIQASRTALKRADFAVALTDLTTARADLKQNPDALNGGEARELVQLAQEVDVVARWPREPLDLIVGRATKLREEEWLAVGNGYLGKGMIFDVIVRRDAAGIFTTTFHRAPANLLLRLNLQNQALLKYLPLNEPTRLLLGARLAELRRDDQGVVHVRLEPDSGVLLTEPAVLAAVAVAVDDMGLADLAQQQRRWVLDLPEKP